MASKLISGINLEHLAEYREAISVTLSETETVELPLLLPRDVIRGELFLRRADTLRAQWGVVEARLATKAAAMEATRKELEGSAKKRKEFTSEAAYKMMETAFADVAANQAELDVLMVKHQGLADEMVNFMDQFVHDKRIMELLRAQKPNVVIQILQGMIYGVAAFVKSGGDEKENPTAPPSPKN